MNESTSLLITLTNGARLIKVAIKYDYPLPYTIKQMIEFWEDPDNKQAFNDLHTFTYPGG